MGFRKRKLLLFLRVSLFITFFEIGPDSKAPGGFSLKLMTQLTVLGHDLRSLSRHHLCSGSVKSVVTSGNWSQPSFQFVLAIVESRPDVFCCDWFLVVALISGRDMNSLSRHY